MGRDLGREKVKGTEEMQLNEINNIYLKIIR